MILSRVSAQIVSLLRKENATPKSSLISFLSTPFERQYGIKPRVNGITSQQLVQDFDDQLNEWIESLPPQYVFPPLLSLRPKFDVSRLSLLPLQSSMGSLEAEQHRFQTVCFSRSKLSSRRREFPRSRNESVSAPPRLLFPEPHPPPFFPKTLVHRPFLPSPQHPISTSPSSMTKTFEAAHLSVGIINEIFERHIHLPPGAFFATNVSLITIFLSLSPSPG